MSASKLQQFYLYEQHSTLIQSHDHIGYTIQQTTGQSHDCPSPGGSPASAQISANSNAVRRVYVAGFRTTVLPMARAGQIWTVQKKVVHMTITSVLVLSTFSYCCLLTHDSHLKIVSLHTFHESSMRGKFQGTMAATTPIGAHPSSRSPSAGPTLDQNNTG